MDFSSPLSFSSSLNVRRNVRAVSLPLLIQKTHFTICILKIIESKLKKKKTVSGFNYLNIAAYYCVMNHFTSGITNTKKNYTTAIPVQIFCGGLQRTAIWMQGCSELLYGFLMAQTWLGAPHDPGPTQKHALIEWLPGCHYAVARAVLGGCYDNARWLLCGCQDNARYFLGFSGGFVWLLPCLVANIMLGGC